MFRIKSCILLIFIFLIIQKSQAQEMVLPLQENAVLKNYKKPIGNTARKPTALGLPFFEDFTDNSPYPNTERWVENEVYINNTMAKGIISRGVATFDALNAQGKVYSDTVAAYETIYADSLTSLAFDLSTYQPSDSLYLSFFYERAGFGFFPPASDSLMLYLLSSSGVWNKVWSLEGDTAVAGFKQVMIPIIDTGYFNGNFKMRWINKATLGISNSNWNLDYIKLDAGRNQFDTTLSDIAFTANPNFILNDFTSMPFRHFKTNPATFLTTNTTAYLKNNGTSSLSLPVNYTSKDVSSGSSLGTGNTTVTLAAAASGTANLSMYNAGSFNPADPNGKVSFEQTFYCQSQYANESKDNDTIKFEQVFDNYFAYDDGTAELSYFLNLSPNAPGATAIEYALYQPDTVRGVAIRFARTQPAQTGKEFSIAIYKDIAINGGSDQLVYQESYLLPAYIDTINAFYSYPFSQPVVMGTGTFYVLIIQSAGGISDSLQMGLDANRVGGNHRYYKVGLNWESSQLEGALMVRPLVGAALPVGINHVGNVARNFQLFPNPATSYLALKSTTEWSAKAQYEIVDAIGRIWLKGSLKGSSRVDVGNLSKGMYYFRLIEDGVTQGVQKFVKL